MGGGRLERERERGGREEDGSKAPQEPKREKICFFFFSFNIFIQRTPCVHVCILLMCEFNHGIYPIVHRNSSDSAMAWHINCSTVFLFCCLLFSSAIHVRLLCLSLKNLSTFRVLLSCFVSLLLTPPYTTNTYTRAHHVESIKSFQLHNI